MSLTSNLKTWCTALTIAKNPLDQQYLMLELATPRSAYFACLSCLTHLIQTTHCVPIEMVPTQCSLVSTPCTRKSAEVYFKLLSLRTRICTSPHLRSFRTWIMVEYPDVHFAGYLQSNGTNLWSDKKKKHTKHAEHGVATGTRIKGIVHPKMKILSLITRPHSKPVWISGYYHGQGTETQ